VSEVLAGAPGGGEAGAVSSCSQRVVALVREPHAGMSQGLWQNVAEITEHNSQRQHALMLALARGEMPYGQFVQEDTLISIRTAAAIRPSLRKLE